MKKKFLKGISFPTSFFRINYTIIVLLVNSKTQNISAGISNSIIHVAKYLPNYEIFFSCSKWCVDVSVWRCVGQSQICVDCSTLCCGADWKRSRDIVSWFCNRYPIVSVYVVFVTCVNALLIYENIIIDKIF